MDGMVRLLQHTIIGSYLLTDFILDSLIWFPIWLIFNISWYCLDAFDVHLIWLPLECYVVAYILVCILTSSIFAIFPTIFGLFSFQYAFENIFICVAQWKFCRLIVMLNEASVCMRNKINKTLMILIVSRLVWNISGYRFSI